MKRYALPALACLLTACSNSSSNGGGTHPPFGGNPGGGAGKQESPVSGVGFTAHAWCNAYQDDDGQNVQERLMFNDGGALSYEEYAWSGQRGQLIERADGTWALNGTVLQVDLNGKHMVFQINYKNPDPQTGTERVHVYMNGQEVAYDPCH
jgi:hypothetical protein